MSGPHTPLQQNNYPQHNGSGIGVVQQIVRDIIQFLTVGLTMYVASVSASNHSKMKDVEEQQKEVIVRQESAATKAEVVKHVLETKLEDDSEQRGIQLYSTWKYLEDVATASGGRKDREKADEARRLYERHLKKEK